MKQDFFLYINIHVYHWMGISFGNHSWWFNGFGSLLPPTLLFGSLCGFLGLRSFGGSSWGTESAVMDAIKAMKQRMIFIAIIYFRFLSIVFKVFFETLLKPYLILLFIQSNLSISVIFVTRVSFWIILILINYTNFQLSSLSIYHLFFMHCSGHKKHVINLYWK